MPVTFAIADQSVRDVLNDVIDRWHEDLAEVELRVCLMLAKAPKDDKGKALVPALKLHGCKCAAIASLIPYKQRAAGADDVRIDIDADYWEAATEAERSSLLDHESNHFEVQRDDEGNVKSDDCGRPRIKIRPTIGRSDSSTPSPAATATLRKRSSRPRRSRTNTGSSIGAGVARPTARRSPRRPQTCRGR